MKISVVIPSYNSDVRLQQGLECLSRQRLPPGGELEVVVADDGSTDQTAEVVKRFAQRLPGLRYVFRARDALSGRSRARNLGLAQASGEVVTFLDAGMLVPPTFIARILERYRAARDLVLLHVMCGIFTPEDRPEVKEVREASPEELPALIERLHRLPEWRDPRLPLFDQVNDELDRMHGAWVLGWSGALSVPRALCERVRGFDEAFVRWGGEDCEFVKRLAEAGASLWVERQAVAVHVPHGSTGPDEAEGDSGLAQRLLIHRKYHHIDTELLAYCGNIFFLQVLARLDRMVLTYETPSYPPDFLKAVASRYLGAGRSLLVGVDHAWYVHHLPVTDLAVHNQATLSRFREELPDRNVIPTLCLATSFEAGTFQTALVTDALRLFGRALQEPMLRELHRIARNVIVVHTGGFQPGTASYGFSCSTLDELQAAAANVGLRLVSEETQGEGPTLLRLLTLEGAAPA